MAKIEKEDKRKLSKMTHQYVREALRERENSMFFQVVIHVMRMQLIFEKSITSSLRTLCGAQIQRR